MPVAQAGLRGGGDAGIRRGPAGRLAQPGSRGSAAPEDGPPEGASPEELAALAGRLGQSLPFALAAWLSVCNAAVIDPSGVFGQRPDLRRLEMA